jgi:transmembrane sensor
MASNRQIELAAATWLARRDAGDWSTAEQDALDAWLAGSTAHRVAFLRLDSAWREAGRLQALGAGLADEMPARRRWAQPAAAEDVFAVSPARGRLAKASMPWRWLGAAMAALVLAIAGTAAWYRAGNEPLATYATAVGELSEVSLADGSKATLSSDSQVQVAWSRRERHIDLMHGEAFFAVAKNPGRPFVVQVGSRQVVAVGTRFSVRRDGSYLRVVVTEGVVRLEPAGADGSGPSSTLLPAGSVALMDVNGLLVRSLPVAQAEHYLDWRSGYVSFHNTPLSAAVSEMNRYSARKIVVADPAIAGIPLGGNFRWSNTDAFVHLLEAGFPVRAEPRGDQVLLHAR